MKPRVCPRCDFVEEGNAQNSWYECPQCYESRKQTRYGLVGLAFILLAGYGVWQGLAAIL